MEAKNHRAPYPMRTSSTTVAHGTEVTESDQDGPKQDYGGPSQGNNNGHKTATVGFFNVIAYTKRKKDAKKAYCRSFVSTIAKNMHFWTVKALQAANE